MIKRYIRVRGTIQHFNYEEGTRPPRGAPWVILATDSLRHEATLAEYPTKVEAQKRAKAVRKALR